MDSLTRRLQLANGILAPYAVPHDGGLGRQHAEPEDETRFAFQRDRDRILHTQAFRRLKHKTQVFVSGTGDHYRTRMTHSLEVAQISRDIARTLQLNEDLAEAIALAHDLGHTPFGHAGEEAMRACMEPYGKRFEHNEQSLRLVTLLEDRTTMYAGLNLSMEILEGLMKHRTPYDHPTHALPPRAPSLEAQLVNLADEIAYTAHDTDDGLRSGLFTLRDMRGLGLIELAHERTMRSGAELRGAIVHVLVMDLYESVPALLQERNIASLHDVYTSTETLLTYSTAMADRLKELRAFLWQNLYLSPQVSKQAAAGRAIVHRLFPAYLSHPPQKVLALQKKTNGALEDAVKDYIAGMTDGYAADAAAQDADA